MSITRGGIQTYDIIVASEKHGDRYWDAQTPEAWAASSLAILTERFTDGFWYSDPDDDGLGTSEWAEKARQQRALALAMTREQINALPEDASKAILRLRREAKRDSEHDRQHRKWYTAAKKVVGDQDLGFLTIGRNRYEHEEPKAWVLLDERSDHQYERVTLEPLERGSRDG